MKFPEPFVQQLRRQLEAHAQFGKQLGEVMQKALPSLRPDLSNFGPTIADQHAMLNNLAARAPSPEIRTATKPARSTQQPKSQPNRSRRRRTQLTKKQEEAWLLSKRGFSHRQIAEALDISKSAAGDRVRRAEKIIETQSRSVATRALPLDQRGQVDLAGE